MSQFLSTEPGDELAVPGVDPAPQTWTWGKSAVAAFRQGNMIGSLANAGDSSLNIQEEGYNSWNDVKGTKYEPYWDRFRDSVNPKYTADLKMRLDREEEDRQIEQTTPWYAGVPLSLAAGMADPTIFIPGTGLVKGVKGGYSIAKSAALAAASTAGAVAIQEAGLQATQELRTPAEGAIAIGTGALLGSVLGVGTAAFLNGAERAAFDAGYRKLIETGGRVFNDSTQEEMAVAARDANAAAATIAPLEYTGRGGKLGEKLAFLNPGLRLAYNMIPSAREAGAKLVSPSIYSNLNEAGESLGAGAWAEAMSTMNGRMQAGRTAHNEMFDQMVKSGISMKAYEFEDEVGKALRTDDVGPNDYVSKAAQAWRSQVIEPFKVDAINEGLLPPDVSTRTAASYFMRMLRPDAAVAYQGEFYNRLMPHATNALEASKAKAQKKLMNKTEWTQREIEALSVTDPQVRAERLASIESEIGNIEDTAYQSGRAYLTFEEKGQISALKREKRFLDRSFAGAADKAEELENKMADHHDAMTRQFERVMKKGAQFEQQAAKLTPEKQEAWYQGYKDDYHKTSELAYNAAKRAEKQAQAIEDRIAQAEKAKKEAQARTDLGTPQKNAAIQGEVEALKRELGPMRQKLAEFAEQERVRAAKVDEAWARLEEAYGTDFDAFRQAIADNRSFFAQQQADQALARGKRFARLQERYGKLDPKLIQKEIDVRKAKVEKLQKDYSNKWERLDMEQAANDMVADYFDYATGKMQHSGARENPFFFTQSRGPMRGRAEWFPDEALAAPIPGQNHGFLENNVMDVMHRYSRIMAAETALKRVMGSTSIRDTIQGIEKESKSMREGFAKAETLEDLSDLAGRKLTGDLEKNRVKLLQELDKHEKRALRDVEALYEQVRGVYRAPEYASNYGRIVRNLNAFNYMRLMGGIAIANLSDMYRPAMVHGLTPFLNTLPKVIGQVEGAKLATKELKKFGLVSERVLHHRTMAMAELGDPFARTGSPFDRFMQAGANLSSKLNGINYLTDWAENVSGIMVQDRLVEGLKNGADTRLLAFLGLGSAKRARIIKQLEEHAEKVDGIWVPNTEKWTDDSAARAFGAAVYKDVTSTVVRKDPGDVPLWGTTNTGKLLFQFRSFNFASNQKVLLRGLDESPSRFVQGLAGMTAIGALVATLQALHGGSDRWEKFKKSAENPGFLVSEGLDRSGVFALGGDASNMLGAATRGTGYEFYPMKTPFLKMFPQATQAGDQTRWARPDLASQVMGPSFSVLDQIPKLVSDFAKDGATARNIKQGLYFVPGASHLGVRQLNQILLGDSPFTGR